MHLLLPHLPHLPVPAVLLAVVHAAAITVALIHPGGHTLAGLVVLAGLVARWAVRSRRPGIRAAPGALAVACGAGAVDALHAPEPAVAPAAGS